MSAVFVDTAYLIATVRQDDQWHDSAIQARHRLIERSFVTTDEVLGEFLTALSKAGPFMRAAAAKTVREIIESAETQVIPQSRESLLRGIDRFEQRPNSSYSLQDCVSMHVMESEGIHEVLTSDRHFEQEGFIILMKSMR